MRAQYGEGEPDDRRHGLRGQMVRRWDLGGMEEWRRFDFKGNLSESARRFAIDYRATPNWTGDLTRRSRPRPTSRDKATTRSAGS